MKLLCQLFGHNFYWWQPDYDEGFWVRECKRCGCVEKGDAIDEDGGGE